MQSIMGGGDSHNSGVAALGAQFDPTNYFMPNAINPHTYAQPIANKTNEWFSTVSKPVNQFMTKITPGKQYLDDNIPILKMWNQTVENRPVDAAAIAAATIFGGGALMGGSGLGQAGLTGAPAASTAGGAGGLGGMGSAASAITPAFGSGVGATTAAGSTGLGTGLGTLGSAGTTAGANLITPASMGGWAAGGGGGLLANMSMQDRLDYARQIGNMLNSGGGATQQPQAQPLGSTTPGYHITRPQ